MNRRISVFAMVPFMAGLPIACSTSTLVELLEPDEDPGPSDGSAPAASISTDGSVLTSDASVSEDAAGIRFDVPQAVVSGTEIAVRVCPRDGGAPCLSDLADGDCPASCPSSVDAGNDPSAPPPTDSRLMVYSERRSSEADGPVPFDIHVPGDFSLLPAQPGVLPSGIRLSSFYIVYESAGADVTASITLGFSDHILALIGTDHRLAETDESLGKRAIAYPSDSTGRGLEAEHDRIQLTSDRHLVRLTLTADSEQDAIRVITASAELDQPIVGGDLDIVEPPASLEEGRFERRNGSLLIERGPVQLLSTGPLDATGSGWRDAMEDLNRAEIPPTTQVASYLLHFDPPDSETFAGMRGSVTFPDPVIGAVVLPDTLDRTDGIGIEGTTYPEDGADPTRGLELGTDEFLLSSDGRSVVLEAWTQTGPDQMRVFVGAR